MTLGFEKSASVSTTPSGLVTLPVNASFQSPSISSPSGQAFMDSSSRYIAKGRGGGECPQRSDRLHAAFCRDVNFDLVSRRRPGAYLTYKTAAPQYRRACYERTGIADRFSLLRVASARSTSVSVYRSRHNGRFSDRQLDRAYALLPIDGERRLPWRG
jgi:hypothetical protein